jgi:hypothetical protein
MPKTTDGSSLEMSSTVNEYVPVHLRAGPLLVSIDNPKVKRSLLVDVNIVGVVGVTGTAAIAGFPADPPRETAEVNEVGR